MTCIIKASCPTCGDVELTPDQIRLVVCDQIPTNSFFSFRCTGICKDIVRKPAGREVIKLLCMGGVVAEVLEIPAEALEDRRNTMMPAINWDDSLDFGLWLNNPDNDIVGAASAGLTLK